MTTKEMISRVRAVLHDHGLGFYITGTTTAAGSVTTFIASALSGLADDFLNEKEIMFTSGNNITVRRLIADWVSSTFTGTVVDQFPYTVASGVTFEIGEAGFWSDQDIIKWLNDGAYQAVQLLSNDALWDYLKNSTTSGTEVGSEAYGRATLPTDCFKAPMSVYVNGKTAKIVDPGEKTKFDRSTYIGTSIFLEGSEDGGVTINVLYKPYAAATLTFLYAPKPAAFDTVTQTTLPARLHPLIVEWAIKRAWEAKERGDLAGLAEKNFVNGINGANAESAGAFSGAR